MEKITSQKLHPGWLLHLKKCITRLYDPDHRLISLIITGQFLLILLAIVTQGRGVILPIGREVVTAYSMLQSTPTGKQLIKDVRSVTRGRIVFLTLGSTERDNLMDECGKTVRGLTRTDFHVSGVSCGIRRVTVIANKDIVGMNPEEIVKSLAFELENVYQVFAMSCACPLEDSPRASITQARIVRELADY